MTNLLSCNRGTKKNTIMAMSPNNNKNESRKKDDTTRSSRISSILLFSKKGTAPLVAGLAGGAASTFLLYPLDLVKVRLQVNEEAGKQKSSSRRIRGTMCNTVRGVLRHEGVLGLYQGLSPALIGSSASWGGYFFFYEYLKQQMLHYKKTKRQQQEEQITTIRLGHLENFTAACLSGAIMVLFTNPIWLVKIRMQLQLRQLPKQQSLSPTNMTNMTQQKIKAPYKSMTDAFRTIIREEGPLALYKGSIPALMLVTHGGVQFVTYEFLKTLFGEYTKASSSHNKYNENSTKDKVFLALRDSFGFLTMGALSKVYVYPLYI